MMLDSPHMSAPMLMRGNALVLKTPVKNAPRASIEKHLSWSSDIPPAVRLTLHRSRPAEYQPKPTNPPPSARRAGRERHDDESDDDEGVQRAEPMVRHRIHDHHQNLAYHFPKSSRGSTPAPRETDRWGETRRRPSQPIHSSRE